MLQNFIQQKKCSFKNVTGGSKTAHNKFASKALCEQLAVR